MLLISPKHEGESLTEKVQRVESKLSIALAEAPQYVFIPYSVDIIEKFMLF